MKGGQEDRAAEVAGQMEEDRPTGERVRGEVHKSSMHGTTGAKAKPGFDAQGSKEPLPQSVTLLWFTH